MVNSWLRRHSFNSEFGDVIDQPAIFNLQHFNFLFHRFHEFANFAHNVSFLYGFAIVKNHFNFSRSNRFLLFLTKGRSAKSFKTLTELVKIVKITTWSLSKRVGISWSRGSI